MQKKRFPTWNKDKKKRRFSDLWPGLLVMLFRHFEKVKETWLFYNLFERQCCANCILCIKRQHLRVIFGFFYTEVWFSVAKKKSRVQLYWTGCWQMPIHRRDPTTDRHGDFCLLRFRPWPVRPSLDNLVTLSSLGVPILIPILVRTPAQHRSPESRTPDLTPFTDSGLQVARSQEHATTPNR